jgi:hypothetical protein
MMENITEPTRITSGEYARLNNPKFIKQTPANKNGMYFMYFECNGIMYEVKNVLGTKIQSYTHEQFRRVYNNIKVGFKYQNFYGRIIRVWDIARNGKRISVTTHLDKDPVWQIKNGTASWKSRADLAHDILDGVCKIV